MKQRIIKMKKKICFIAQFPPPIHGLSKAVDTIYHSKLSDEFEFEKIDITNNKNILKNIFQIWRKNPDLFYFTISQTKGGNIRDLIILKLISLKKEKCLIHLHGGYYRHLVDNELPKWLRKINYQLISKLDGVVVLSRSLKNIFKDMITDEKIFEVPNCVDDQYLMAEDLYQEKLNRIEKKEVSHILYLSNFIKSKGYPEVLELVRLEKERCERGEKKRFHFDFAGKFFDEEDKRFFTTYIQKYNLENFITYHGIVDGEKKRQLLYESDIFILLTRYPNEGQPISILEAMGNGLIIVTTNHSGIPDIVEDKINGIVEEKNSIQPVNIFKKLLSLQNNSTVINNNRKVCLEKYTESHYLSNIERLFKQL
jgi:glycosyltransferase involved in cell wall biosynthesis